MSWSYWATFFELVVQAQLDTEPVQVAVVRQVLESLPDEEGFTCAVKSEPRVMHRKESGASVVQRKSAHRSLPRWLSSVLQALSGMPVLAYKQFFPASCPFGGRVQA